MRIRKKKWAPSELSSALFFEDTPKERKNHWKDNFKRPQNPFYVELGCGKCLSTSLLAANREDINILAIDLKSDILAVGKRNVDEAFQKAGRYPDNIYLTACNIENLSDILGENDKIDCLLINFCNPWPKSGDHKHRLTHTRMLKSYKQFLKPDSLVLFKTDDDDLFISTKKRYFPNAGYEIIDEIFDLPEDHEQSRYVSEHEKKFREQGLPIHYIAAKPIF